MEHLLTKKRTLVIGGANIDICGTSAGSLLLHDSNIGTVTFRSGGVGRNIAHDLLLLGAPVSLLTAIGDDLNGAALFAECERLGLDMALSRPFRGKRSSAYLYLSDRNGDLLAAVNDMEITECITPEYLAPLLERINSFDAVVADANLSERTIRYLAENCTAPIVADAVSAAKARRLLPLLPKLRALKVNLSEAQALTGEKVAESAANALLSFGAEQVYVTLGADGLYAAERGRTVRLPAEKTSVINTNGAGDAVAAAITCSLLLGMELPEAASAALHAAALAVSSPDTNPDSLQAVFAGGMNYENL